MDTLGIKEGGSNYSFNDNKSIERAQKKIEAMNFASRKNIIEYDDVMNYQREVVYNRRNFSLHAKDISLEVNNIIEEYVDDLIDDYLVIIVLIGIFKSLSDEILNTFFTDIKEAMQITDSKILKKFIIDGTSKIISFKKDNIESELFDHFQRFIVLKTIDKVRMQRPSI